MIFIQNKYTKWYNNIISNAQTRSLPENTYIEKHHIIPRSLGGSNSNSNLTKLTAKEHYVCHLLLIKMIDDKQFKRKMQFALNSFRRTSKNNQKRFVLNSRQYEFIRKQVSQARSEALKGNTYGFGRIVSAESRLKSSLSNLGKKKRPRTEEEKQKISQFHKGKILSEETKQKMRKPKSKTHIENIRKANLGKKLSEETIEKMRIAAKIRHVIYVTRLIDKKVMDWPNYCKWLARLSD
jgi:NUMOD3 motif